MALSEPESLLAVVQRGLQLERASENWAPTQSQATSSFKILLSKPILQHLFIDSSWATASSLIGPRSRRTVKTGGEKKKGKIHLLFLDVGYKIIKAEKEQEIVKEGDRAGQNKWD